MFGVQLYKNNARALLSRILSIVNLDWLQHARSVQILNRVAYLACRPPVGSPILAFIVLFGMYDKN